MLNLRENTEATQISQNESTAVAAAAPPAKFPPRGTRSATRSADKTGTGSGNGPASRGTTTKRGLRIAIEGPLRVGKSTLAGYLAERVGCRTISEPVGNPFLSRFYAGEPGMAFAAQMWFLRERTAQLHAADKLSGNLVADYMLEKDKLFAHLTLSDAELAIYKKYFAAQTAEKAGLFQPDLVIYLRATPDVLKERRKRRNEEKKRVSRHELRLLGQDSGSRVIGQEYAAQVSEAYEHFFTRYTGSRLLVVDTSAIDFVSNPRERDLLLDRILAPVHGREHFMPMAQIA
jgi:deoxyguanosine kinase